MTWNVLKGSIHLTKIRKGFKDMSILNNHDSTDELLRNIKKHEALIALSTNQNFRILIEEGYLNDELIKASNDFTSPVSDVVNSAHNRILGIALLKEYFEITANNGENSRKEIGE